MSSLHQNGSHFFLVILSKLIGGVFFLSTRQYRRLKWLSGMRSWKLTSGFVRLFVSLVKFVKQPGCHFESCAIICVVVFKVTVVFKNLSLVSYKINLL